MCSELNDLCQRILQPASADISSLYYFSILKNNALNITCSSVTQTNDMGWLNFACVPSPIQFMHSKFLHTANRISSEYSYYSNINLTFLFYITAQIKERKTYYFWGFHGSDCLICGLIQYCMWMSTFWRNTLSVFIHSTGTRVGHQAKITVLQTRRQSKEKQCHLYLINKNTELTPS